MIPLDPRFTPTERFDDGENFIVIEDGFVRNDPTIPHVYLDDVLESVSCDPPSLALERFRELVASREIAIYLSNQIAWCMEIMRSERHPEPELLESAQQALVEAGLTDPSSPSLAPPAAPTA